MHFSKRRTSNNSRDAGDDARSVTSSGITPASQVMHNAHIHVRPRHMLAGIPEEEHQQEACKIVRRISAKQIDFSDNKLMPSKVSESVLENIGKCLQDYFELEFMVVGHVGIKEAAGKSEEEIHTLGQNRAEECMKRIYSLADASYLQVMGLGTSQGFDKGLVTFEPLKSRLLGAQERMNLVVLRCGWDFPMASAEISERGRKTAQLMAAVLQGSPLARVVLTVPRTVTPIGYKRSEAIARALKETNVPMTVVVRTGNMREDRATVTIENIGDENGGAGGKEPHEEILEILQQTPLAFLPNSANLAPDVLPVLCRCAEVLKRVDDKICVVEAYSGKITKGADEGKTLGIMMARAQSIVDQLKAEGVRIPCRAEGHAGPYPMSPESRRPCVVITLDDATEDDDTITEHDDPGHDSCCW